MSQPVTRRSAALVVMSLGLLIAPLAAEAQQPAKIPRIGILWPSSLSSGQQRLEAFRQGLRELGYYYCVTNIDEHHNWRELWRLSPQVGGEPTAQ